MTIDEATRRSLYDSLAASLGGSQADTLMSLLPYYPLAELATRDDMYSLAIALRGEMALGFGKVDRQFAEMRADMNREIAAVRGEMRGEIAAVRAELGGEIASVRGELAELRSEMAELRGELAELRGELAELAGDLRAEFSHQVLMLGLLLGTSLLAVLGTVLTLGFSGAFA